MFNFHKTSPYAINNDKSHVLCDQKMDAPFNLNALHFILTSWSNINKIQHMKIEKLYSKERLAFS